MGVLISSKITPYPSLQRESVYGTIDSPRTDTKKNPVATYVVTGFWSEYRDSNPRPLGPEIAQGRKSNSNVSIMYDPARNQRFYKLPCPTRPYGSEALWVTVWVRQSCRSAKVGVFRTFKIGLNRLNSESV